MYLEIDAGRANVIKAGEDSFEADGERDAVVERPVVVESVSGSRSCYLQPLEFRRPNERSEEQGRSDVARVAHN
jgi:hypothetical protein